jgi:hypothetical protein
MAKKKPAGFSVPKAVRRNARERVGQPPPARALRSETQQERAERRHRKTLAERMDAER